MVKPWHEHEVIYSPELPVFALIPKNRKNGTDYVYIHNPFHFFLSKTGKYANFSVVICVYASFCITPFHLAVFSYNRKGMSEGENI